MLGSKFVTLLRSILNRQVNSFSNIVSFFIVITHNTLVNFKLIHFLLWIKRPNHRSLFLQILHHSLASWNITLLYFFSSNIIYFSQKQSIGQNDPMKVPILTLSNVLMKICQIPDVIFQTTSQFFYKFCMTLQCN